MTQALNILIAALWAAVLVLIMAAATAALMLVTGVLY